MSFEGLTKREALEELARIEGERDEARRDAAGFESKWARAVVERDEARGERDAAVRQRDAAFAVLSSLGFSSRVAGIREGA